jgi:hypothetical protein
VLKHYSETQRDGKLEWKEEEIKHFNASGEGAFYMYKKICDITNLTLIGDFTDTMAGQIIYHCIFGTYKEDLGVLEQITNCGRWYTREELGKKFQGAGESKKAVVANIVRQTFYSKLSSANQSGLLSSYLQVSSVPVFSGKRVQTFGEEFFESIGRKTGLASGGKTIEQLNSAIKSLFNEVKEEVDKRGEKLDMGTVEWRSIGISYTYHTWDSCFSDRNNKGKTFPWKSYINILKCRLIVHLMHCVLFFL